MGESVVNIDIGVDVNISVNVEVYASLGVILKVAFEDGVELTMSMSISIVFVFLGTLKVCVNMNYVNIIVSKKRTAK